MADGIHPKRWPGETDEAHPEAFSKIPTQPKETKPGQISKQQVEQFFKEGMVVLEDFFQPDELEGCKASISEAVDDVANKLYHSGKIKGLYKDVGIFQRLTKINEEFPDANIVLIKRSQLTKAFFDLWNHERLLNVMEQLLGPDISGNPVWNLRAKLPQNDVTNVPWHQDVAYCDDEAYKTLIVTGWIPMLDTNEQNGCLQFVKLKKQSGKICRHVGFYNDTWYIMIPEGEIQQKLGADPEKDIVTVPVKHGSLVLFNNVIPHRSLSNTSKDIRWSFDFRWQRSDMSSCFYGLLDGVVMRSSQDPKFRLKWDDYQRANHKDNQGKEQEELNLDTTIQGPWMKRWEIVHHNRHTAKLDDKPSSLKFHNAF